MRIARLAVAVAAILVATPGIARAATIAQPFKADSGDICRHGVTEGTLAWQTGVISPLPLLTVGVTGTVTDRPLPIDPTNCHDDGYNSTATFVAYAGGAEVDRQSRTADNSTIQFRFSLGSTTKTAIDRVVVQVCRNPIVTLPPSYCGKPVTYLAPPVFGPAVS
ncbi:MAG TPA: hypothetical protein VFW27_34330 [Actinoplanes sp.]|jgi:hypothetical protein|nr:hypothetical protein [Actinoplanes sp.]